MVDLPSISKATVAKMIDYSILSATATSNDVERVTKTAIKLGVNSVCVNPFYAKKVKEMLAGSDVKLTTTVGYPLGANLPIVKSVEAEYCVKVGADDLDMVMNIGAFKNGDYDTVRADIGGVVNIARKAERPVVVKVIIESGYLTDDEIVEASKIVMKSGADFVKTGTGFGKGAVSREVRIIRNTVGKDFGIKAAGGIRTLARVLELIEAGATRIGTSSAPQIINEIKS